MISELYSASIRHTVAIFLSILIIDYQVLLSVLYNLPTDYGVFFSPDFENHVFLIANCAVHYWL